MNLFRKCSRIFSIAAVVGISAALGNIVVGLASAIINYKNI